MNRDKIRLFPLIAIVTCLSVAAFGLTAAPSGADPTASVAKKFCKKKKNKKKPRCKKATTTTPTPITTPALKPALKITPPAAAFTAANNSAGTVVQFVIQNTGAAPTGNLTPVLTITSSQVFGTFQIVGNTCTTPLAPQAVCSLFVQYFGAGIDGGTTGTAGIADQTNSLSAIANLTGVTQ